MAIGAKRVPAQEASLRGASSEEAALGAAAPLLEIEGLRVSFLQYGRGLQRRTVQALAGVDLSVGAGELVALVGSSGSGKSLLAHAVMGLLPDNARSSGSIRYAGEPLDGERLLRLRGKELALVPQGVTYLDPLLRAGEQALGRQRGPQARSRLRAVFSRFGLPERAERLYPHQLSGGMARKVLVSAAALGGARLVVADEPTPGMEAGKAAEALQALRELADGGCGVLLLTHDIEAALRVADRVAVLYAGEAVELAAASDFAGAGERLRHPYTRALWQALPANGFRPLPGVQPAPEEAAASCAFAARCGQAAPECRAAKPAMRAWRGGQVRCFKPD
ncbi:ABC transporter ATP-binding protein [Paenibacillus sp. FSL W8-1187]|uniref:oligopeptide/dipeptide ABC transporter ATP-binding protein n=1 Tax=unclassified Paenibacillus TaxID=185978 RepID=UPI00129ABAA2|nr:ABC transporter ATP-binding protein [Paenibacillus sp. B01]QGG56703.1 ATP-binding cassette domain-containing protein [Paenibacillus sp. B01]